MALMHTGTAVVAAALCSILVAAPSIAQKPPGATKAATGGQGSSTDLIGRPVDLDLTKGVQAPFRDTSSYPPPSPGRQRRSPSIPSGAPSRIVPRAGVT